MLPWQMCDRNLREAMRCYSWATDDGESREMPGLAITSSGVNYGVFNSAMLTSPAPNDLERRICTAGVHFSTQGLDWSFWLCEDLAPSPSRRIFERQKLYPSASPPGMYAERLLPQRRDLPDLECREVLDEATRNDFCDVASAVFVLPYPIAKQIYGDAEIWKQSMTGYVGYTEGKPVAIVTTVVAADAIGVYSLATRHEYQGRGYGEWMLRRAVEKAKARTGLEASVLQSTKSGMKLYRRLGYSVVTRFTMYLR